MRSRVRVRWALGAATLVAVSARAPSAPAAEEPPVITLEQALAHTKAQNITWASLGENLVQANSVRWTGVGMFLPKIQAEGQWVYQGERYLPDLSSFNLQAELMATLTRVVIEEHPARFGDFIDFIEAAGEQESATNPLENFIPPRNTLAATFSLIVPVINPGAIPFVMSAFDRYDAALQRVGHGREQILYAVCRAYYGLVTLQEMIEVAERTIEAAEAHFESNSVKAGLQAATQLDVRRAELELTRAQAQRAELVTSLERSKAFFRRMTGIRGDFRVRMPRLRLPKPRPLQAWIDRALKERRDLLATRIEQEAAATEVGSAWSQYAPNVDIIGQARFDNAPELRFDDDPFSWSVVGALRWNLFDGGIREADLMRRRSVARQADLAVLDLEQEIETAVTSAERTWRDAITARELAERQLEVAQATVALTRSAEEAGAVTNLEVIDVNQAAYQSEAALLRAQLDEAMAVLELLSAVGAPVPFEGGVVEVED